MLCCSKLASGFLSSFFLSLLFVFVFRVVLLLWWWVCLFMGVFFGVGGSFCVCGFLGGCC